MRSIFLDSKLKYPKVIEMSWLLNTFYLIGYKQSTVDIQVTHIINISSEYLKGR